MKFKSAIFTIILYFLFCPGMRATQADSVVKVQVSTPSEPVSSERTGYAAPLTIELEIARRYHINSNRPLQEYLVPTSVTFEPLAGVTFDEAVFPEPEVKKLPVSDTPMSVYEGTVKITANVLPSAELSGKEFVVRGHVRFQACDNNSCLPPVRQPFSVTVPVPPTPLHADAASSGTPAFASEEEKAAAGDSSGGDATTDFDRRGLLMNLLFAFAGGLALNLTPCVYPLIPVTLAWFGGQSEGRKGTLIGHAGVYVLGMAVTYSVLGVVAAMTGSLFGAAMQYPVVLVGMALVMAALALGMFDVYELRVPSFLTRLAGASSAGQTSRAGLRGTLFLGLTMGIVAAPCIGPFVLGLLTYVGGRGDALVGFLLFFSLALGLGLPFLVLGLFSGSIRLLPRSGAWMVWVRKVFGFVLLAMAVYFLRSLLPPIAYPLALGLVLFLGGIYLAWLAPVPGSGKAFVLFRHAVGCLFFVAALYVVVTGLQPMMGGIAANPANAMSDEGREGVRWERYSPETLALAAKERMPVFIDFYADWCAPCRELDAKTYADPEVIRLSHRFVMVKADLTSDDDPAVKALREKFRIRGVPTLVFLRPDGGEMPSLRGTGFESAGVFSKKMNRALRAADAVGVRDGEQKSE